MPHVPFFTELKRTYTDFYLVEDLPYEEKIKIVGEQQGQFQKKHRYWTAEICWFLRNKLSELKDTEKKSLKIHQRPELAEEISRMALINSPRLALLGLIINIPNEKIDESLLMDLSEDRFQETFQLTSLSKRTFIKYIERPRKKAKDEKCEEMALCLG